VSVAPDYAEPIVGWRAWLVVVRGGGVAAAERRLRRALAAAPGAGCRLSAPGALVAVAEVF
jgi:hypothetical protein